MKKYILSIVPALLLVFLILPGCQPSGDAPVSTSPSAVETSKARFISDDIINSPAPGSQVSPSPMTTLADLPMESPGANMGEWEVKRYRARFSACQSNLKVIGVAIEMYQMDNSGALPSKLGELCPLYIKNLPFCPDARTDTYSGSYSVAPDGSDYIIYCKGHHHGAIGAPADYPRYSKKKGIIQPQGYREDVTPMGASVQCKTNLKNLATALEMYATDNVGRYPKDIKILSPMYLKQIPTCPAAGRDTYSSTYSVRESPDAFTIYCKGHNHGQMGIPEDYPLYDSNRGLIEKSQ